MRILIKACKWETDVLHRKQHVTTRIQRIDTNKRRNEEILDISKGKLIFVLYNRLVQFLVLV
jgi:hypothetical protein